MRVQSARFAGQTVVVNDALVAFDADGNCAGIVALEGGARPLAAPEPLRPEDIEVMRQLPEIFSVSDEDTGVSGISASDAGGLSVDELLARYTERELRALAEERGLSVPKRWSRRQIAERIAGEKQ